MNILSHTARTLEWPRIKERLSQWTLSSLGAGEVENLECYNTVRKVEDSLLETLEMANILKESSFPDIEIHDLSTELERCKAENSYLFTDELIKIALSLKGCREVKQHILHFKDQVPRLLPIVQEIETFKSLEDRVFKAVDSNGKLTDHASKELSAIRKDTRRKKSSIEKRLHHILRDRNHADSIQDFIVTLRENRFVIPIKKDHKGRLKGIVLDTSNSGETLFIEPESVVEDNNTLIALFREEKEEEIRILKRFTKEIHDQLTSIRHSFKHLGILDLIHAKGKLGIEMQGIAPDINDTGVYKLLNASHPLLKGEIVPINLYLGEDYDILIITGPNTGGKTVALKTFGLITMMAMAGLLIPAQEGSTISIADNIFIDSGDEQSIQQNLSTFSGHIKRIIEILQHATQKSLVLIDELGAGTDPDEGTNLGLAVLDQLREIACKTVVTTHYAKIKSYFLSHPRVENASCDFDLKSLKPTYKLLYGVSGKSNALDIARRLGLDESIVKKAEDLIQESTSQDDRLIGRVYEEQDKAAHLSERYQMKLNELSRKEAELKVREDLLKKEINELKRKRLLEDQQTISETRRHVLKLYEETRLSISDKKKLKETMNEIDFAGEETQQMIEEVSFPSPHVEKDHQWQVGENVYLESLNKVGKILDMSKSTVTVRIGDIKIKTDLSDLRLDPSTSQKDSPADASVHYTYTGPKEPPPYELHLRGMRGDEAVRKTEYYIENLYTSDRESGRIIHGKGTGTLRILVENVLNTHPHVKSYHLAKPEDGGYGVTEVLIK